MRTEDWMMAAGIVCLLIALAAYLRWAAWTVRRDRRIRALRRRRESQLRRAVLYASGPEDWAWPRFPERVAAQIAELQR